MLGREGSKEQIPITTATETKAMKARTMLCPWEEKERYTLRALETLSK